MGYIAPKDVAKMVRADLKTAFAEVSFRVTSSRNVVRVGWIDGPTEAEVKEVVGKYHHSYYDMHEDLWKATGENNNYGNDHLFLDRTYSLPFYTQVVTEIANRFGVDVPEIKVSLAGGSPYIVESNFDESMKRFGMRFSDFLWREIQKRKVGVDYDPYE